MKVVLPVIALMLVLLGGRALALIETYEFSNQALEVRYHKLTQELRCPKCQNQNIADSDAPIAQDLRQLLHQQLEKGASDEEILQYMVARYGEFVRYRPRFGGVTIYLWLAPVLLLLVGIGVLLTVMRSRTKRQGMESSKLSAQERDRLQSLMEKAERDS
jgi:cytochrome c-type biogenesis protein CcmH